MKSLQKATKILLSFSKAERIGLAMLLALLVLFLLLPRFIPQRQPNNFDVAAFKRTIDSLSQVVAANGSNELPEVADYRPRYTKEKNYRLFAFDPNTANATTFEQLGFSQKQAAAIVSYRTRGAVFRTASDFAKVFVVSAEKFEELQPYIQINVTTLPQAPAKPAYDSARFPKTERVLVELNTADTAQLVTVRGIGSYTAAQIVKRREQLGGFTTIEQLSEIKGMTAERLQQLTPQLSVNKSLITTINLVTADENSLKKHPYIGAYAARGIVHYRKISGTQMCTIDELVKNNILKAEQAEKLRSYCEN